MENSSNSTPTTVEFNVDRRCPIQYVTVYNDRAEVTRSVQYHFNVQGTYDLVFEGFSPSVDLTSLHVSGGTGKACTILEVSYQTRHEEVKPDTELKPLDQLRNELDQIQKHLDKHQQELARLVKQRTWLDGRATKLMNHDEKLSGSNDLDVMQQFLEFYYKNLTKLDEETTNEQNHIKQLTQEKDDFEAKISQHGAKGEAHRQKMKREVTVTVHIASDNVDIALEISYLISNCSWRASYDVRVNSTELEQQKTQLTYYGIIVNQSQENWSNVQLSLSTAKPSLGGAPPKLATLRIDYEIPRYNYRGEQLANLHSNFATPMFMCAKKPQSSSFMRAFTSLGSGLFNEQEESIASPTINVLATETEASMSSSSFSIPRRATIDADGKPHKVTIGVLDLSSTFTYTIIPKLSLHAYLKATTTNTSDKQLLAGPAAVFMDNNFITHSSIDNVCLGDTFDLPLGIDASIKVEYKPVKRVTDTQGLISKINCENIYHETRVVNTKSTDVTVYIYEQVPLSSDEKIRVKLLIPDLRSKEQDSNCTITMNDANNLEWKCILQPKGECRCPLNYTVDWPKDKRVEYKEA